MDVKMNIYRYAFIFLYICSVVSSILNDIKYHLSE